jgi:hypothetical protein
MSTWIPLLVRTEDYAELATLVAAREALRPDTAVACDRDLDVAPRERSRATTKAAELLETLKPWSVDDLRQIIDTAADYKTMDRWARAIDVATARPEQFISTAEIAAESGMTVNEWRDAPRKLPQHLTAHFPPNIGWPLLGVGGRHLGRDDQAYWAISIEQAKRWTQARHNTDASTSR